MAGGYTQIIYNNFANFFNNDWPKLDLILANNRQFEIWPKWTILTSVFINLNQIIKIFDI